MQTRYMERSNSKRGLDSSSAEEGQPDRKRPALASVIVEALKVDSLQKLCSSLEPILRRVVSEEVERALAKLGPAKLTGRSSPKRIEGPDGRNLQLHFRSRLSLPLFTGGKVEGEQGAAIHIVLIDASTGLVVTSGPEALVKLDVVVLEGDFNNEDDDDWTEEEFDSHVVKEREGKRPLLTGDLQVTLKEGVGSLGELTFTDNSSWIRSRKFRLGLKVASGCCEGIRIREAKTDAFTVKDHRGELYKKHYPPFMHDEVWRLEKIGKDGSFHKRLNKAGISTVEDFLRLVVRDSQRLRNILGSGMSNKMWDLLVEHAKTCVLSGKLYVYYPDDARNVGVVFNNIYELSGLIANGQYYSADSLSDSQKVHVDTLVKKAYDNWMPKISNTTTSIRFSASPSPPMDHPHSNKRVAVCGGGVIGVCTAYFLAKKGATVTLIEKSSIACAASGKAGGFLAFDWCDGGALSSLARASFNLHRSLAEELNGPDNYGYRPLTTLSLTVTESQIPQSSRSRNSNSTLPSWVDGPAQNPRTIGSPETTAQLHPQLFTKTLLNKAVDEFGVEVVIGKAERVNGVERGRVDSVVLEGGRVIESEAVVLALGPWSGKLEMLSSIFRVYGLKAHSIVVEPKEGAAITPHALFLSYYPAQGGPTMDPEVYPRPNGEVYVCGMSSEQEVPDNPEEISGDPASIQVLKRVARTVSSHLGEGEAQVKAEQACFLPCTDDSVPVIGEIPGAKGCYVATGHSCWGILNGPATGAALAELVIDGHASIVDLSRFSPARFVGRRKR